MSVGGNQGQKKLTLNKRLKRLRNYEPPEYGDCSEKAVISRGVKEKLDQESRAVQRLAGHRGYEPKK